MARLPVLFLFLISIVLSLAESHGRCRTDTSETGVCRPFRECYPFLDISLTYKTPINAQLQEDILESTTLCGNEQRPGGNRTFEDVICCVESKADEGVDVIMIVGNDDVSGVSDGKNEFVKQFENEGFGNLPVVLPPFKLPPLGPTVAPPKRPGIFKPPGTKPPKVPAGSSNSSAGSGSSSSGNKVKEPDCLHRYVIVPPGTNAYPNKHAYPFMAALINKQKRAQFCGGSLIDSQHVLTAQHCLEQFRTGSALKNLAIYLGSHDLSQSEASSTAYSVSRIYKHAGYNGRHLRDDLAILELSKPVASTKYVQPLCLVSSSVNYDDGKRQGTVAGWGRYCPKNCPTSPKLRHVPVRVWTNQECSAKYGQAQTLNPMIPAITKGMVCAALPGSDACEGDSGGPLFIREGDQYQQIGVVSWGIGCGEYPGVYTRVSNYRSWIQKNVRKFSD